MRIFILLIIFLMLSCEGDVPSFFTGPSKLQSPKKEFLPGIISATAYLDDPTINGHTPSLIFGSQTTNFRPFVIKVDKFGNILGGTNVIENSINEVDFTLHYTATSMNFVFSKDHIIIGANNAWVGTNPLKSYVWILPQF